MPAQRQPWIQRMGLPVLLAIATLCLPSTLAAQDERSSFFADLAKEIVFDPTTYAPTIIGYDAMMRDWRTSQPFFQHGFLERNPAFTVSGLPFDAPLSYQEGRRMILKDTLVHVQVSLAHNLTSRILERMLMERLPENRTLIRVLGWIERAVFASFLAYDLSHRHYQQAQENERLAIEFGFQ